jgi:lysophospholipase L1-like esterase
MNQRPFLLAVAASALVLCVRGAETAQPFEDTILAYETKDKATPPPAAPILFVGSSTFRGWSSLEQDFAPLPVLNRGFGGSTMKGLLHFFDRIVLPYRPRLIVVYEGDNDLAGEKAKAEDFLAQCMTFIERVREELPGTEQIFFIPPKPSAKRWSRWPEMKRASDLLKELAAGDPKVSVIDTAPTLLAADGTPDPSLFKADGLHLNAEGNARWLAVIRPVLEQALRP